MQLRPGTPCTPTYIVSELNDDDLDIAREAALDRHRAVAKKAGLLEAGRVTSAALGVARAEVNILTDEFAARGLQH